MLRFILLYGALSFVLVFRNVPGQSVETYNVNVTNGSCYYNGTKYEKGENDTPGFCGLWFCDTDQKTLTLVNCSNPKRPPPPCVLDEPQGAAYPGCCPDSIC
uniref:Putative 8.9 kDa family member n=1 Tax=Rhipicephalus pulchellus TaxID=72859 RepID=L7MCD1_RHIPC